MSRENLDAVRRFVDAFNTGGLDAVVGPHWDESVELFDPPGLPDADRYVGKEAVRPRIESYLEFGWDGQFRVEELIDAGDEVVMVWRFLGQAPGAEVPLDGIIAFVILLHDGKIRRFRQYLSREEALAAVGLRE